MKIVVKNADFSAVSIGKLLDLPDELITMTFEEIEQYYEESKSDDIVKTILENVSKNMEESNDVGYGEE